MILVWDLPIRAFHWLLVAAVGAAAVTGFVLGNPVLGAHLIAGAAVAGLIGARVIWGLLGPTHARFADFAYGPQAILGHVRDILAGREHRHLGHNPLGALMVFALLLVLAAMVATGTVALGGMLKQGPLAPFASYNTGRAWFALHQPLAWLLLAMIAVHLGGVAFESRRGRENLTRAMLTGRKRPEPAADVVRARHSWPIAGAALVIVLVGAGAASVMALAALSVPGVPPAELDPAYDGACGSCHFAFSPSLNPAWVWNDIMGHLDHHFGLRVTLDPREAVQVRAYLDANSAEHWDTLPAHVFRARDPAEPLRITATPVLAAQARRHPGRGVPAAVSLGQALMQCLSRRCRGRPLRAPGHRHSRAGRLNWFAPPEPNPGLAAARSS